MEQEVEQLASFGASLSICLGKHTSFRPMIVDKSRYRSLTAARFAQDASVGARAFSGKLRAVRSREKLQMTAPRLPWGPV
jgi:hypothetical protein